MRIQTGCTCALLGVLVSLPSAAQLLNNQYLKGKYFFRQVSLGTDAAANLTDPRSLIGTLTFDGGGGFVFTGQQVVGTGAATAQTGTGTYSVDPAGFVAMDSPLRKPAKVNARVGPEALVGSGTESADNTFDVLIAIPAPAKAPTLAGPYWTATLEFPGGSAAGARNTLFSLAAGPSAGQWADFTVTGHAASLQGGQPISQAVTGATFMLSADGSGTATFGAASAPALLSGGKSLYVSASGNVILGGSTAAGSHDILIGVKAVSGATNTTWNGDFWGAGLRFAAADAAPVTAYAGAAAARGLGFITWSKRYKGLGAGAFDFTGVNYYTLASDGSAGMELTKVGLAAGNAAFVGSAIDPAAPGAFEIFFGAQMAPVSGSGVFLHPRGVVNLASYGPAGTPIAPGEFIALFGSGLASSAQQVKTLPLPPALGGVTVTINGVAAPLYYVAPDRIYAVVPSATEGPAAAIVVQNATGKSNTVTVPVAATTPGIFSLDETGTGAAAILHADYTVVNASSPAVKGETVAIYLTGLGTVTPPVDDGAPGGATTLSTTTLGFATCDANSLCVLIGGRAAAVSYAGLVPGLVGVYQINATVPSLAESGNIPLAIETPNAFHDQVYVVVK